MYIYQQYQPYVDLIEIKHLTGCAFYITFFYPETGINDLNILYKKIALPVRKCNSVFYNYI
ncbi:hypothetical protein CEQ15_07570 [Chryseobacterium indologenes]|nr:hypothetical protein CEQ15_07570 [Chryseobacterium indologenes]